MTPTDYAKVHLKNAKSFANRMIEAENESDYRTAAGAAIEVFAYALEEMATGLRATYLLLDQMNKKLDNLERTLPRR